MAGSPSPTASPPGAVPTPAPTVAPDSAEGAAQVLGEYYAAINARDFARAYRLWENEGQASGQSFAEFQQGFAETGQVAAQVGPPGPIGAAAGSRYVVVPVELAATTADGRGQWFQGTVVLRRAVVDGATPEQRRWHIYRAEIAELPTAAALATPSGAPAVAAAAPVPSSEATPCHSSELQLAIGDPVPEPTGQHTLSLTLVNRSTTSCFLFGYPQVSLLDDSGRELPFTYRQSGDQVVTPHPPARVELPPGRAGYVTINKYRCDLGDRATARRVQLVPPGEATPLQMALPASTVALNYCGPGDPGSIVSISPVGATRRDTLAH